MAGYVGILVCLGSVIHFQGRDIVEKADLPAGGHFVKQPKDKYLGYYYTNDNLLRRAHGDQESVTGLFRTDDGGKTWFLCCRDFQFLEVFVHPDTGELFAIISSAWLDTDPRDGFLKRYYTNKGISSKDGYHWRDITGKERFSPYAIVKDPDHAGRVCFRAYQRRACVAQSLDDKYTEWKLFIADSQEGRRILRAAGATK